MIIFNTTFHLSNEIYLKGIDYLISTYIPKAVRSGILHSPRMMRVLDENADVNGVNLAVQFSVADIDAIEEWVGEDGAAIQKSMVERFNDEIVGFSTFMEEIEL